jgi:hypothetical protein
MVPPMTWANATDDYRAEVADLILRLCRLFGAGVGTSHLVAGQFIRGLDNEAHQETPRA